MVTPAMADAHHESREPTVWWNTRGIPSARVLKWALANIDSIKLEAPTRAACDKLREVITMAVEVLTTADTLDDERFLQQYHARRWERPNSIIFNNRTQGLKPAIDAIFELLDQDPNLRNDMMRTGKLANVFDPVRKEVKQLWYRLEVKARGNSGIPLELELYVYENPVITLTKRVITFVLDIWTKTIRLPRVIVQHYID